MKHSSNRINCKKSQAYLLIFLGWLVYATSYLGKVNYSANKNPIMEFYNVTKEQAGLVSSFFFFSYGIGQVFHGIFCKKYNPKWMVFISLIVSATINLTIAVSDNFAMIKWLWAINGFTLSILWPTIIRLLSESLPQKVLGTSSVVMGTTVAVGTLVIYGLSSVFVAFSHFKLAFYTAAFAVIAVAILWIALYGKAVSCAKSEKDADEAMPETDAVQPEQELRGKGERKLLFTSIYVLCFFAIGVNLIKDGLTEWVPTILKESFRMSDSLSILLTLFLPILAVFGNAYALRLHKKIPDYVSHCAAVFAVSAVFIGIIIGSLAMELVAFMLLGLIAVNFLASSLNSLVTSIFPLFMRGKVNSGLFAGILNGFCYLGSTISSYGLGAIAQHWGWNYVFYTLGGFCVVTVIVWVGYTVLKRAYQCGGDS